MKRFEFYGLEKVSLESKNQVLLDASSILGAGGLVEDVGWRVVVTMSSEFW